MSEPIVKARGLVKRFGSVTALNGSDFDLFSGEVLAVIGDNGAGKSTTMSVLTGLFETTKGSATVLGVDLFGDRFEARKFMGICP